MMKTIRMTEFGSPDVLQLVDAPTPEPAAGQILIRVESAGVNFADVMRRRNDLYPFPTPLPFTPGSEVAGTVEQLGEGVGGPPVGTPIFALAGQDGSGGYSQFALAQAEQVIPIPPGISADEAAGIIVAGSTAMLTLTEVGRLTSGETVLIEGAGGGLGQLAVQVAKLMGATVIGAASTAERRSAATKAGADHVVDNSTSGWGESVASLTGGAGVDLVLHLGGDATFSEALTALKPFGRVVVLGLPGGSPLRFDDELATRFFYTPALNHSLHVFNLGLWFGLNPETSVAALTEFIGYVASGRVSVPVSDALPLSDAARAHELLESRSSTGKIVLKPWA